MLIRLVTQDKDMIERAKEAVKESTMEFTLDVSEDGGELLLPGNELISTIIILDHNLPTVPAEELVDQLRISGVLAPIVMLVDDFYDAASIKPKVSSISKGASLCLGRDFDPKELATQFKYLVRLAETEERVFQAQEKKKHERLR